MIIYFSSDVVNLLCSSVLAHGYGKK